VSEHWIYPTQITHVRWEIQIDPSSAESDIFGGGQIYPFLEGASSLEPDQGLDISDLIHSTCRIYPTEVRYVQPCQTAMTLEPDQGPDMSGLSDISNGGWICLTRPDCHNSRT
jgi:hypothetical protein